MVGIPCVSPAGFITRSFAPPGTSLPRGHFLSLIPAWARRGHLALSSLGITSRKNPMPEAELSNCRIEFPPVSQAISKQQRYGKAVRNPMVSQTPRGLLLGLEGLSKHKDSQTKLRCCREQGKQLWGRRALNAEKNPNPNPKKS